MNLHMTLAGDRDGDSGLKAALGTLHDLQTLNLDRGGDFIGFEHGCQLGVVLVLAHPVCPTRKPRIFPPLIEAWRGKNLEPGAERPPLLGLSCKGVTGFLALPCKWVGVFGRAERPKRAAGALRVGRRFTQTEQSSAKLPLDPRFIQSSLTVLSP